MMVQDIEKYMDYCRLFIGEKCAVTDEEIDEALNQFANMFTHIDKLEVKKRLMSLYTFPINPAFKPCFVTPTAIFAGEPPTNFSNT